MKRQLSTYTFSASGKTITLGDIPSGQLRLDRLLLIVNLTRNVVMFNLADPAVTASVATNVVTLSAVPAGSTDTDKLAVFYDVPDAITKHVNYQETLTANTVPNSGNGRTLTPSGFHATELEITNIDGAAAVYGTLDGTTPVSTTTGNFLFVLPATPSNIVLPVDGAVTVKLISAGTPKVGYALPGFLMTVLKTGSVLTTGGNVGDTQPGMTITVNPSAGAGQSTFGTVDYMNAPIWVVTPKTGNGQIVVYGDYLRAFPGLAAAVAGAAIGFDSGNPNGRNPAPLQFPEGTASAGMRVWSGTGAPGASTIGGAASLGDVYHRRDGSAGSRFYRCTTAGTPGTWTAVA